MSKASRYGWRRTSSRVAYKNDWISVREDSLVFPSGAKGIYGVVQKAPGVCVVPVDPDGRIYFLRQYRYTVDEVMWELPAGGIQPGESERQAVRRELSEEMGLSAANLSRLGNFYVALGHEDAEIIAYAATGLKAKATRDDRQHDETILEVRKFSPAGVRRLIRANRLNDGVALSSLAFYFAR